MAIKVTGAKDETFGVIFATARTQVDKVARTVVFEDMQDHQDRLPDAAESRRRLRARAARRNSRRKVTHDLARPAAVVARGRRRQAADGRGAEQSAAGASSATRRRILVPIDGAPVMKPVPDRLAVPARHQHARADPAGRARRQLSSSTCTTAGSCRRRSTGPWTQAVPAAGRRRQPSRSSSRRPASSTCSTAAPRPIPKPSLANGVPTIYTSQVPAELIVFKGQPDFVPIVGTQLLWASNTTSDVLINTANNNYYVLLVGPLVHGDARSTGRGRSSPSNALPAGLRADPAALARRRRAAHGRGHAAGAGSGHREFDSADRDRAAQERAEVHAEVRRPAAVRRRSRARRSPTSTNSHVPIIQVAPERVLRGDRRRLVHRGAAHGPVDDRHVGAAGDLHDPAVVADLLRDVRADLRGDAAGRLRRLHAGLSRHGGRAVRHGRLRHRLRVLAVDRQRLVCAAVHLRRRRGADLQPVRRLHVRLRDGTRHGRVDGARSGAAPTTTRGYWGGYRCCAIGERQRLRPLGRHHLFRHALVVRGRRRRGHDGERQLLQQPHGHVGQLQRRPPVQRVDRQRDARLRPHDQRRRRRLRPTSRARATTTRTRASARPANAVSGTGAGGSTYNRAGATTAGPEGNAHVGGGSTYNAKTGQTNTWGTASVGNNHYADVNGNVYKNTGDGWQQHSSSGWNNASGDYVVGRPRVAGAHRPATTGSAASARRARCRG